MASPTARRSRPDGGGREQFSSTALWSVDAQFAGWRSDPNVRTMDLTLDKSEYQPGETAQILVQSPFAQPVQAWLVVELSLIHI